jgi:hypothetical protein
MKRRVSRLVVMMLLVLGLANRIEAVSSPSKDRELWVTSQSMGRIHIRELHDGKALGQIVLPAGAQPHIITFHSGMFAYVSDMGSGKLHIIDAQQRQIVQSLSIASSLTHQAKVSPNGTIGFVTVVGERKLVKVAVDEANRSWRIISTLSFFPLGKSPICTVFRADSQRAYVSMLPNGIAIVDVPTMTLLGTLDTDGFIACGMIKAQDGNHVVLASSGGGGHIYTLNMMNDSLMDRGTLGAASWHSFNMLPDGSLGFGTSPLSDELIIIDLTTQPVTKKGTIQLVPIRGNAANQPDALGGGDPIVDNILPVSLRAAGQFALIDVTNLNVKAYIPISLPTPFDPGTCSGCAIHGVTVRPTFQ